MGNKSCRKCGSCQIKENIYQRNIGIILDNTETVDTEKIRKCKCENCRYSCKEFA